MISALSLLMLLLGSFLPAAQAQEALGTEGALEPSGEKTIGEYLMALDGDDAGDRLMAARVLRGQLRRALRMLDRGQPGTLAHDDARALMIELDERLPEACLNALAYPNVAFLAAEMLAMLEIRSAAPAVERALAQEARKGPRRRMEAALALLTAPEGM